MSDLGVLATGGPEPVTISVCVTCRAGEDGDLPGARLLASLRALPAEPGIEIRPVQCMSVCKRPCTAALGAPQGYTYVFGDLDPVAGATALLEGARAYAGREHGFLLWGERPEALRRTILARIPPPGWRPPDGRHPR